MTVLIAYLIIRKLRFEEKLLLVLYISLLTFWIVSQVVLVLSIEIGYVGVKSYYSQEYQKNLEIRGDKLNATWYITALYRAEFSATYGTLNATVPNRVIQNLGSMLLFAPILGAYLSELDGFSKLIVVQKKGNCEEFAKAISFLLNNVGGLQTRIISMEGIDHAFPEVYVDGKWWVFDKIYTTPDYPVEASRYASHLENKGMAKYVANLKIKDTDKSVLSEHGFSTFNLTVVAILDMTNNPSDDKAAANADVEIFAMENSYDPLVAKGKTDKSGKYTVILNSQNSYIVIVKKGLSAVGIAKIDAIDTFNKTVEIHLHKYG